MGTLDGDISKKVQTDGNTVDSKMAFLNYRSCYDIRKQYKRAKSGDYMITMWNAKSLKVERISVWCDMYNIIPATYTQPNQQEDVKAFKFNHFGRNTGSCPAGSKPFTGKLSRWAKKRFVRNYGKAFYLGNNGRKYKTDTYVCKLSAFAKGFLKAATRIATRKAEVGKYVIRYYVNDKAGNDECTIRKRTIVVKDTLPPVISLKYGRDEQIPTFTNSAFSMEDCESPPPPPPVTEGRSSGRGYGVQYQYRPSTTEDSSEEEFSIVGEETK